MTARAVSLTAPAARRPSLGKTRVRHSYVAHGYRVSADVPLPLPSAAAVRAGVLARLPTLDIRAGAPRRVPAEVPDGSLIAHLHDDRRRTYYAMARTARRIVLRFPGAVELVGEPGTPQPGSPQPGSPQPGSPGAPGEAIWTYHVDPGAPTGLVSVLAGGTLLATRLLLDGHLVLHASAVVRDGGAVAIVGAPGMGKSTLAALAAADGLGVLTDDVLRVDLAGTAAEAGTATAPGTATGHRAAAGVTASDRIRHGAVAWPGASELRLRTGAAGLAEQLHGPDATAAAHGPQSAGRGGTRWTADGRLAVTTAPPAAATPLPLRAVVVPRLDREARCLSLTRLAPGEALRLLLRFPRLTGLSDTGLLAEQLELLGRLCTVLPVAVATLPWGPPFDSGLVGELLDAVAAAPDRRA